MIYDVIVIGAGPAGCQCARELSRMKKSVLLVEKAKDFTINNFSSAGAPLSILKQFSLPEKVIGRYWNQIRIYSTKEEVVWKSQENKGVVLDFMQLRSHLTEEAKNEGCKTLMGWSYQGHVTQPSEQVVTLKEQASGEISKKSCKILVDATGSERVVMSQFGLPDTKSVVASGIEFLVQTDLETHQRFDEAISFYFGLKWMPQGYGWIFPMSNQQLKIGVCRYFLHQHFVPYKNSFQYYMDQLIAECLDSAKWSLVDRHGKTLRYLYGQKDLRVKDRVIGIGDAISLLNPLAGEGIRHAMVSARLAAIRIEDTLKGNSRALGHYSKDINRICRIPWKCSEVMMHQLYKQQKDWKMDCIVKAFKRFNFDAIIELTFYYKFKRMIQYFFIYLFYLMKGK